MRCVEYFCLTSFSDGSFVIEIILLLLRKRRIVIILQSVQAASYWLFTSFIFDRYSKIDFTLEFWGVVEDKKIYNFEKLLNTRREKNQFFVIENIFSHPPRISPNWGNKKGRRETNKFINKRLIPCCCEIKISKNIRIYYIFCSQPKRW